MNSLWMKLNSPLMSLTGLDLSRCGKVCVEWFTLMQAGVQKNALKRVSLNKVEASLFDVFELRFFTFPVFSILARCPQVPEAGYCWADCRDEHRTRNHKFPGSSILALPNPHFQPAKESFRSCNNHLTISFSCGVLEVLQHHLRPLSLVKP